MISMDQRLFRIICRFPAMKVKVEKGFYPGLEPDSFDAKLLADSLYRYGGSLSSGEFILLEFLLNLYDPDTYHQFNLGRALQTLGDYNSDILIKALQSL